MKKILILLIVCLSLTWLVSCNNGDNPNVLTDVDIDFTLIDDPYTTILGFMTNPEDVQGKSIAINAQSSVIYNFASNKIDKRIMLGIDPAGCCNAYYEIRTDNGNYPNIATNTTFIGDFTPNGYIDLKSYDSDKAVIPSYEIDTLDMTANELKNFINSYSSDYFNNENREKTVRIFGHLVNQAGYKYLLGLDQNGAQTWFIELYDPTGSLSFPVVSGNLVNPIEVIGKLSFYREGDQTYACISVERVSKVECVFS